MSSEVSKNRIQSKPKRENFKLPKDSAMAYVLRGDDAIYRYMFRMRKRYFYQLLSPFTVKWQRIGITSGAPLKRSSSRRRHRTLLSRWCYDILRQQQNHPMHVQRLDCSRLHFQSILGMD